MNRTQAGTLAGLALAAFVAVRLGGTLGNGVMIGALSGAAVALTLVSWCQRTAREAPAKLLGAVVGSFLIKLALLLAAALVLRFFEPVAAVADWRGFLVAFAATASLCMTLGSFSSAAALTGTPTSQEGAHP